MGSTYEGNGPLFLSPPRAVIPSKWDLPQAWLHLDCETELPFTIACGRLERLMANTGVALNEWRFDVRDEQVTHVHVLIDVVTDPNDAPLGVQGWHYKAFPARMSLLDILQSIADGDSPVMWPQAAPGR